MASIPGGPADKLGNEFERLWLVRHAIEVVAGRAVEVQVESLGADERGVEFWITRPSGLREGHQCKRENGSEGNWGISDLDQKGILANARFQLDRSPSHHFYFVSGDKAPAMADLCERANRGDPDSAFLQFAVATNRNLKKEFERLCKLLSLDPNKGPDVSKIRDSLRRFHVQIQDKSSIRHEVEVFASCWITGEPTENIASLESYLSRNESFGRPIRDQELVQSLPSGSRPTDLSKDVGLSAAIRGICFSASSCSSQLSPNDASSRTRSIG